MKKNNIIRENRYHTVIDDGNYIIKEFKVDIGHLDEEWSILYTGFNEDYPDISLKLIDFTPKKKIVIEKVEGIDVEAHVIKARNNNDAKKIKKLLHISRIVLNAFSTYSLRLGPEQFLYHKDLNCTNIIIQDIDSFKFKIIDIDSITFNHDDQIMRQPTLDSRIADHYYIQRTHNARKLTLWK
jgi:hypothetical protein